MNIRKNDTERAINLLKIYKAKLNKTDDEKLRKTMEKLIESLQSQLYNALLDIHELYEDELSPVVISDQQPLDKIKQVVVEEQQVQPSTSQTEKPKKSKQRRRSKETPYETDTSRINAVLPDELLFVQEYKLEEPKLELEQDIPNEQVDLEEEDDRWEYFEIQLTKGKKGYGFAVDGGFDKNHYANDSSIFITKIIPGGTVDVDGRLRIDDALVSVNETNLEYVLHDTAVEILKNAGKQMTLVVRRFRENNQTTLDENPEEESQWGPPLKLYSLPMEQTDDVELSDHGQIQEFEIILTKKPGAGLGFSVSGGYDNEKPEEDSFVYISRLTPGGVAHVDGRLQLNDVLLMVDDQSLDGITHDESVALLKNTGRSVKLLIGRFIEDIPEEPVIIQPEKKKKKNKRDR